MLIAAGSAEGRARERPSPEGARELDRRLTNPAYLPEEQVKVSYVPQATNEAESVGINLSVRVRPKVVVLMYAIPAHNQRVPIVGNE